MADLRAMRSNCKIAIHSGCLTRMHRPKAIMECSRIRQVAQRGCKITTCSESNASHASRLFNIGQLQIIDGLIILFASLTPEERGQEVEVGSQGIMLQEA